MREFWEANEERRRELCRFAAERLSISEQSIEKDLWVCLALELLFDGGEDEQVLTFKGGTSLSKVWGLIQRFSEDLDLVIDRSALGFDDAHGPDAAKISSKERDRRLERLKAAASQYVHEQVWQGLLRKKAADPRREGCELADDPGDEDRQTILLRYRSVMPRHPYLNPVVKLEFGARSDVEPREGGLVRSYLAQALEHPQADTEVRVRVVAARRTFWEKAMLLHEQNFKSVGTPRARLSRHLYDLYCLLGNDAIAAAVDDDALFERVAAHRRIFFKQGGEAQSQLRRGQLRIVPDPSARSQWKSDFERMREAMFFGEPPSFDEIVARLAAFESRFNRG